MLLRMTGSGAPQANWGQGNHFLARCRTRSPAGCGQRPRMFGLLEAKQSFAFYSSAIADVGVSHFVFEILSLHCVSLQNDRKGRG